MSNINVILDRLDKVKSYGGGRYKAICPCHAEKTPSLSLKECDNDTIIIHCFGCGSNGMDVCDSLSLDIDVLFPEKVGSDYRPEKRPFPAMQILECLSFEAQIVSISAKMLLKGDEFTKESVMRLEVASNRIHEALQYAKR